MNEAFHSIKFIKIVGILLIVCLTFTCSIASKNLDLKSSDIFNRFLIFNKIHSSLFKE